MDLDAFPNSDNQLYVGFHKNGDKETSGSETTNDKMTSLQPIFYSNGSSTSPEITTVSTNSPTGTTEARPNTTDIPLMNSTELQTQQPLSCSCTTSGDNDTTSDFSQSSLEKVVTEIRLTLLVNRKETSMALRRLKSYPDSRPLSAGLGIVGISVCVLITGVIVWPDFFKVGTFILEKLKVTE